MLILGISAYYHDSAAALVEDGKILCAAQEERFSRNKHDARFPRQAVKYCLEANGFQLTDIDHVVFYDKPLLKFDRLLETYIACAPKGFSSFIAAMPIWLKEKLYLKSVLRRELADLLDTRSGATPALLFSGHHQSHAASAFYPAPFTSAAVLCLDGVGEWATTSVWYGEENRLFPKWELHFPHSLGLLYSAFTYYAGFKVNSGEYKLMGLAPYGEPRYAALIKDELIDIKPDGTFKLNMAYFNYATGRTMTNRRFARLFGGDPRLPEAEIAQKDMDIAASIQAVVEEVVVKLGGTVRAELGSNNLCLAGGVALNCVANGKLLRERVFDNIWVQPAAGDAGGAVGAALATWYELHGAPRSGAVSPDGRDAMQGAFLGPAYSSREVRKQLDRFGAVYTQLEVDELLEEVARLLADGNVVGWFQGRMEFGPRALGCRSILGDPRSRTMQSRMNLKIKYRESFRPFAPAVLAERASEYFELEVASPYMLIVANVNESLRVPMTDDQTALFGIEKLNVPRSKIPAVTHVDYSARVQTVDKQTNPRFHALLQEFERQTGCAVLVNTSFNVRGEPIVCTPQDAYRCFMNTRMDYLVIEDLLLSRRVQPQPRWSRDCNHKFDLD